MDSTVAIIRRPDPNAELGYVCPECKAWSPISMWAETEVGCEDCGSHGAVQCSLCEERIDTVYNSFEEPDAFLRREAKHAGVVIVDVPSPEQRIAVLKRDAENLELFLKTSDDRLRQVRAALAAARREVEAARRWSDIILAAWRRAVGARLVIGSDLVTSLEKTTLDMRLHLDELAEDEAVCRHDEMVAEYGPFTPSLIEEDA